MVVGVGIDLVEVKRIRRALENPKTGARFRDRVYTKREVEYCERGSRRFESYAGRFAAKEAAMKALGVGWGSKVGWLDVEVLSTLAGQPEVSLHGSASAFARKLGIKRVSLSISHTEQYAMATLIAEG